MSFMLLLLKGALEAAAKSLSEFCAQLLASPNYDTLPEKWLMKVITELHHGRTAAASVTRRSAGLPLLVRAIVSSEQRGSSGGRYLLTRAIEGLLLIFEMNDDAAISETQDVPQCHALHILQ